MVNQLLEIQWNIAKAEQTDRKVQNLASYINVEVLKEIHEAIDGEKATGIDKVTKQDYEQNLEENLQKLVQRMKNRSYKPQPVKKRVYIPKDVKGKYRPLGISCYEDKLVEQAIAQILNQIYEPKFYNESYGFRPKRSCHMAVRDLIEKIQYRKTNYVVEADIRGFFDVVDHGWLIKMLEHDIADRKFIEIIRKFLNAGIMENGKYLDSETGTPQGNGASPILANIYLHYVLDNWFDVIVQRQCTGECYMVRYADDFVCCFQNRYEAQIFLERLKERFQKYGLELESSKTKILEFGRFAADKAKAKGKTKPETFEFLGFTFYCSTDRRKSFFRCKVKTSGKKYRNKLKAMNNWIKQNRNLPIQLMISKLNMKLRGHYQYYGVTDNTQKIKDFYDKTMQMLYKWLNKRSQRRSYTWESYRYGLLKTLPLQSPTIKVNLLGRTIMNIG